MFYIKIQIELEERDPSTICCGATKMFWEKKSLLPVAQTAGPERLPWPPGLPERPAPCLWYHCWYYGHTAPGPQAPPQDHKQHQQPSIPVRRRWILFLVFISIRFGILVLRKSTVRLKYWTVATVSLTFSSILVSLWSSLQVSELLEMGEALMDSDKV